MMWGGDGAASLGLSGEVGVEEWTQLLLSPGVSVVRDPCAKQRSRAVTGCQQLALKVQLRRLVSENYQRVAHAKSCFARRGSWVRVPSSPPV